MTAVRRCLCKGPVAGEEREEDDEVSVAEWSGGGAGDGEAEDGVRGIGVAVADVEEEEAGQVDDWLAKDCSICCQARKVST